MAESRRKETPWHDLQTSASSDLMLEIPSGTAGMGMQAARQLVVDMMDAYGVQIAQIGVNARDPEPTLELFEKFPGRFFGAVGVDPNTGMESVRALEETVKLHPNIKAASAAPCLLYPQVPIDDKRFYPIYAKCCELGIPINMLVGVPGPRVPYKCQYPGLLDEVAWFFPDLKVVMRHGGDPWTDLCVKLLLKWPNLYYSTTAWAPKHYPRNVLRVRQQARAQQGDVRRLLSGTFVRTYLRGDGRPAPAR